MKKIYVLIISIISFFYSSYVYANGIYLSPSELKLGIGKSSNIKVVFDNVPSGSLIWSSSNPSVASVNNGQIIAHSIGKTIITVTDNNSNKATCSISVIDNYIPISSIVLTNQNESLLLNESRQLDVKISPDNASNKLLVYSSTNPDIVSVNQNGVITGKKVGSSYITISAPVSNAKTGLYIDVTDKISLSSIKIQDKLQLKEGSSSQLTVGFTPSNATDKKITWKSSDTSVATVDSNGNVSAKKAGATIIRAVSNDGGHVATCNLTVLPISKEVESISLSKTNLTIEVGKEEKLSVIFTPTYALNQKVSWKSSNELIATVENGIIKAKKPGTVEIKVISDEKKKEAICQLTVISPPIESISFEKNKQSVSVGSRITLKTKSIPENTSINNPIWTSSDMKVATIKDGVLTALSIGTTVITVSNEDGTIKDSTEIIVVEKPAEPLSIEVSGYELNFKADKTEYTLKIGQESSLNFSINVPKNKVIINGNKDLKNGSIITVTINGNPKKTYVINIKKKENYTIYFIGIISFLLLLNIIRMVIKNKK